MNDWLFRPTCAPLIVSPLLLLLLLRLGHVLRQQRCGMLTSPSPQLCAAWEILRKRFLNDLRWLVGSFPAAVGVNTIIFLFLKSKFQGVKRYVAFFQLTCIKLGYCSSSIGFVKLKILKNSKSILIYFISAYLTARAAFKAIWILTFTKTVLHNISF